MSVNLIPILIDQRLLADEITRLRKTMPCEKFDSPSCEIHFHDALAFEDKPLEERQYAYAKFSASDNTRDCFDADEMRFQLLRSTRASNSVKAAKSADALFRFVGEFFVHNGLYFPFNEHGLTSSMIIGAANARRLHLLFQQIDFEVLRPFHEENCRKYDDGSEFGRITNFDELVSYVTAFDDLLLQAIEKNKTLYMFAS